MNKVLHIIQSLDSGGCENMLLRTLPLLNNFEHFIITLNGPGELADKFRSKNISVINIGQKNFLDIFAYARLLKTVKKNQPDLIITYLFHADATGRLFLQFFTKISTIPCLRTTYNHKKYRLARLFEKLTKFFVKRYLANSQSVKNFYVRNIGVNPDKITVIPNGISVNFYDKIVGDENLKEKLGIGKEDIAIICVASLHANKGHRYLLEAFEEIYEENKKIKLLIVGDGEEKNNLLKQSENYSSKNNILFLGKRNDVPQLLKISNIFVLPTLFEGMSNAIMEAMACCLPVITTGIPENEELIENNKSGILVPIKDTYDLKKQIFFLLRNKNLSDMLGKNARIKILQQFDIGKIVKNLSSFITLSNRVF
jgi:glycosyltransferase involved in cell wall biosynthesis